MRQHWWQKDSMDDEGSVGSLDTKQLNIVQQSPIIRGKIIIKSMANLLESFLFEKYGHRRTDCRYNKSNLNNKLNENKDENLNHESERDEVEEYHWYDSRYSGTR